MENTTKYTHAKQIFDNLLPEEQENCTQLYTQYMEAVSKRKSFKEKILKVVQSLQKDKQIMSDIKFYNLLSRIKIGEVPRKLSAILLEKEDMSSLKIIKQATENYTEMQKKILSIQEEIDRGKIPFQILSYIARDIIERNRKIKEGTYHPKMNLKKNQQAEKSYSEEAECFENIDKIDTRNEYFMDYDCDKIQKLFLDDKTQISDITRKSVETSLKYLWAERYVDLKIPCREVEQKILDIFKNCGLEITMQRVYSGLSLLSQAKFDKEILEIKNLIDIYRKYMKLLSIIKNKTKDIVNEKSFRSAACSIEEWRNATLK